GRAILALPLLRGPCGVTVPVDLRDATTSFSSPWPARQVMTDTLPLPDLHTADLDDATVAELFTDLHALAEIITVRLKCGEEAHADRGTVTLDEAFEALSTRRCVRAQLHYRYRGETWVDTLIR